MHTQAFIEFLDLSSGIISEIEGRPTNTAVLDDLPADDTGHPTVGKAFTSAEKPCAESLSQSERPKV